MHVQLSCLKTGDTTGKSVTTIILTSFHTARVTAACIVGIGTPTAICGALVVLCSANILVARNCAIPIGGVNFTLRYHEL